MNNQIIKDGVIETNKWIYADTESKLNDSNQCMVLSLKQLNALVNDSTLSQQHALLLEPDENPSDFLGKLTDLPLIAVKFPAFTDGRGFSLASILRNRYKFKGELRAYGHFIRDQLAYLQSCGFNSFEFLSDEDLNDALKSLADFSESYQGSAKQGLPLFRRRNN